MYIKVATYLWQGRWEVFSSHRIKPSRSKQGAWSFIGFFIVRWLQRLKDSLANAQIADTKDIDLCSSLKPHAHRHWNCTPFRVTDFDYYCFTSLLTYRVIFFTGPPLKMSLGWPPHKSLDWPPLNLLWMRITKHLDFFRSLGGGGQSGTLTLFFEISYIPANT